MAFKIKKDEKQFILACRCLAKKAPDYLGKLLKKLIKDKKVPISERDAQYIKNEIWYIEPRRVEDLEDWEATEHIKDTNILYKILRAYIKDTVWSEKN